MSRPLIFNLVVSNVPGPQQPLYLLGRRLREIYPFVPLSPQNHALSIGMVSYDGQVFIGLVGDRDVVPDLDRLATAVGEALREQPAPRRKPAKRAAASKRGQPAQRAAPAKRKPPAKRKGAPKGAAKKRPGPKKAAKPKPAQKAPGSRKPAPKRPAKRRLIPRRGSGRARLRARRRSRR
jgi:hypothetical protein